MKERSYDLFESIEDAYELLVAAFASNEYLEAQEKWKQIRLALNVE